MEALPTDCTVVQPSMTAPRVLFAVRLEEALSLRKKHSVLVFVRRPTMFKAAPLFKISRGTLALSSSAMNSANLSKKYFLN